jgi:sarcosine oxidase subunit gamma
VCGVTVDGARAPLAHRAGDLVDAAREAGHAVEIEDLPFSSQVDLRVAREHAHRAPLPLPLEPNTVAESDDVTVLWLGPDEWLVVGRPGTAAGVVAGLERGLEGIHHSAVDVSANRAILELRGPARLELLSKVCSIDLHPRSWAAGRCAQTLVAGVAVILHERMAATRVYVRPSFGDYLVDWMIDSTTEYSLPRARR